MSNGFCSNKNTHFSHLGYFVYQVRIYRNNKWQRSLSHTKSFAIDLILYKYNIEKLIFDENKLFILGMSKINSR